MIDLHCHILPGIDDGAPDLEAAVDLARAALEAGTRTVVATPHISWAWPDNDARAIAGVIRELRDGLAVEGLGLEVHPGAEVALTRAVELADEQLAALTLGGGPWLLVEPPITPAAVALEGALMAIADRGHALVIAHPERIPGFQRDPGIVARLVDRGMLCQLTASSLAGRFGRDVQRFAERLLHDGLVHVVASDAHSTRSRSPAVLSVLRAAGLSPAWVRWLTDETPAAIVGGEPMGLPPSTAAARRTRRRLLRSR